MNRRDFIKTLTAAAGSATFASTALAATDHFADNLNVVYCGYEEAGNGWYRIWKTVRGNMSKGFNLDFGKHGLHITEENKACLSQIDDDLMTFSCYIKGPNVKPTLSKIEMWGEDKGNDWLKEATVHTPQVEVGVQPTSYISTSTKGRSGCMIKVPSKNIPSW